MQEYQQNKCDIRPDLKAESHSQKLLTEAQKQEIKRKKIMELLEIDGDCVDKNYACSLLVADTSCWLDDRGELIGGGIALVKLKITTPYQFRSQGGGIARLSRTTDEQAIVDRGNDFANAEAVFGNLKKGIKPDSALANRLALSNKAEYKRLREIVRLAKMIAY